ncbi:MAG: hypothetical protein IT368_11180 [Candidatus Hydrogenedentes bacterium]|nr:hypothetical protein [Candidatus Hydrogenedentota bacterium]
MPVRTKEHYWPQWLIRTTNTQKTGVRFTRDKRISPLALTIPMCDSCNSAFGRELEGPMAAILNDLESGRGISDTEAEIFIRWLWKFEGLAWRANHPNDLYTLKYTVKERVLRAIDDIRQHLTLAVSLTETIEPDFGDSPMGLDSESTDSAVYVAGVFSRVAVMVLATKFSSSVPKNFSLYKLADINAMDRGAKLFYPAVGFSNSVEAVGITRAAALHLSYLHGCESRDHKAALALQSMARR